MSRRRSVAKKDKPKEAPKAAPKKAVPTKKTKSVKKKSQ